VINLHTKLEMPVPQVGWAQFLDGIARTTYQMRPIVTDRAAWSVSRCVGRSVCHTTEPCKNGRTDRDADSVEDSGGLKTGAKTNFVGSGKYISENKTYRTRSYSSLS